MDQRIFHGAISPQDMADALVAAFNHGNLSAQKVGQGDSITVQIASRPGARSGGRVGLTLTIQKHADGIAVALGQEDMLGVAASLGKTAFFALQNPLGLLGRLDDIAQDVGSLTLKDNVWAAVEKFAQTSKATKTLSARLQSVTCPYCGAANKVGDADCVNCGGPLGESQPIACPKCGNVMPPKSQFCGSCGAALAS